MDCGAPVVIACTSDFGAPAKSDARSEARPTTREELEQVWRQLSAATRKPDDSIDDSACPSETSAVTLPPPTYLVDWHAATTSRDRPLVAQGCGKPPVPSGRAPLAPVAVPQPTTSMPQIHEAKKSPPVQGGYPVIPTLPLNGAVSASELSTRAPSCVSARNPASSPRRSPGRSPRDSPRQSPRQSPRNATSPRGRMTDVLHGSRSIIRYPECRRQHSSIMHMTPRGPRTFTDTVRVPRNLAGDHHSRRAGYRASNECLEWLKQCQTNTRVEDLVEDMLIEQQDPNRIADYQYARDNLRKSSYRDATMSATSMAGRTKPSKKWC